jgi:hypothetical protein
MAATFSVPKGRDPKKLMINPHMSILTNGGIKQI